MEIKLVKTFSPVLCLVLCLGISGCGSSPSASPRPLDPPAFGQDYKFADNEMKGWTLDPASDAFWVGTDLIAGTSIDGAAQAYTDQGFVQGMFQTLDGPNLQTVSRHRERGAVRSLGLRSFWGELFRGPFERAWRPDCDLHRVCGGTDFPRQTEAEDQLETGSPNV